MSGNAKLGRILKEMRERRGISLVSAARAIGTDRHATISEIESGRRKVSFEESVQLAGLYGASVGDLMQAVSGRNAKPEVAIALARAEGDFTEPDRMALARLERLARDYSALKRVLD